MASPEDVLDVGDRVDVGFLSSPGASERGTVRFLGATHFERGEWVGVELDTARGKNDGMVMGLRYFMCPPSHGIFCRPAAVVKMRQDIEVVTHQPHPKKDGQQKASLQMPDHVRPGELMKPLGKLRQMSKQNSRALDVEPAPSTVQFEAFTHIPPIGSRVIVQLDYGMHTGTVRFAGTAYFTEGEVIGVALDDAIGKHDGAVGGVRYFTCASNHGVFVRLHALTLLDEANDAAPIHLRGGQSGARVLCQSPLRVGVRGASMLDWAYCVLTTQSFQHYKGVAEYQRGSAAQEHTAVADVTGFKTTAKAFYISTTSNTLMLFTRTPEDRRMWKDAWDVALNSVNSHPLRSTTQRDAGKQDSTAGSVGTEPAVARSMTEEAQPLAPPPPLPPEQTCPEPAPPEEEETKEDEAGPSEDAPAGGPRGAAGPPGCSAPPERGRGRVGGAGGARCGHGSTRKHKEDEA